MVNAINLFDLFVFIDNELLVELENNIADCLMIKDVDPVIILKAIKAATLYTITQPGFVDSPDPKDNFLFDLALQTESEVIVTQEKSLLSFTGSPVAIHDIKWFKENFPVPL